MGDLPPRRQRPFGITLLCVVLAWLAVAGFGNAVVWNSASVQAAQRQLGVSIGGPLFSTAAIAYGIMALTTSVGLWRMARWAGRVYPGDAICTCSWIQIHQTQHDHHLTLLRW